MMNNNEESYHKMNINWFPGHMAKTRREIEENLKLVDVVIEILDARIPISSQNPNIKEIVANKKKIVVLNKCDMSEEKENDMWIEYFKQQNSKAILVDCTTGKGINETIKCLEKIMEEELKKYAEKGRVGKKIKAMILGIPNVGKSTFINKIAKKNSAEVGNKPGVTRQKQWIRVNDKIELLDTPGVLWPKFESQKVALNLAFTGTIKDDILERTEIAYELVKYLIYNYRKNIIERFKISNETIENILAQDQEENFNIYEIMQLIGKNRGAVMSGGIIDDEKTARIILEEFRSGKLGKISLEKVKR